MAQTIAQGDGLSAAGFAFAILYGVTFGFWWVAGVAIAEKMVSYFSRKTYQVILFVVFLATLFATGLLLIWFGPGNTAYLFTSHWAHTLGVPAVVPVVIYLAKILSRP